MRDFLCKLMLIFSVSICLADADKKPSLPKIKLPGIKLPGKKDDPLKKLMDSLTKMPAEVTKFVKLMGKMSKTVMKARKVMTHPNSALHELEKINHELDAEIQSFEKIIDGFRNNAIYQMLQMINQTCGSPPMTVSMSVPYIGTAVAGMCNKIGAVDLKVSGMLFQAETVLSTAMSAKERMTDKLQAMQAKIADKMHLVKSDDTGNTEPAAEPAAAEPAA